MEDSIPQDALRALETEAPCRLTDLNSCPRTPGVYTLWDGEGVFLYVGIARVDPKDPNTKNRDADGVRGRLSGYVQTRLDSDFAVRIFLRYVVPNLSSEHLERLRAGTSGIREMSRLVRTHVEQHVTFRAWGCDKEAAIRIESYIRRNGLPHTGKPFFNPA